MVTLGLGAFFCHRGGPVSHWVLDELLTIESKAGISVAEGFGDGNSPKAV